MRKEIERLDEVASSWFLNGDTDFMVFLHSRDKALLEAVKGEIEKAEPKHKPCDKCLGFSKGINIALAVLNNFIKEVSCGDKDKD